MNKDRRLANLFFLCFSLISVLLLLLPVGPFVRSGRALAAFTVMPALKWSDSSADYLSGVLSGVSLLLRTEEENRRLRQENKDLELLRAQLDSALEENGRLRETMQLPMDKRWTGVWARVASRNRDRWYSSVVLDKGEKDGVLLHSPVVAVYKSSACVAGKIIEVLPGTSKLLLVTDPMFSVTASMLGFDALAEGQGRAVLRLNYLPPETGVPQGSMLATSEASTVFPPGLLVGRVQKLYPAHDQTPFVYADVEPAISPGLLREVFIITGRKGDKK